MEAFPLNSIRLITNQVEEPQDWVCEMVDVGLLHDPVVAKFQSPKLKMYMTLMKKGEVFPPVVVTWDYEVIDGTHRYNAHLRLGHKKVPVLRARGRGKDTVENHVYKNGYFRAPRDGEYPTCFMCKKDMEYAKPWQDVGQIPTFPNGLPRPPFYFCRTHGFIINPRNYVIWEADAKD